MKKKISLSVKSLQKVIGSEPHEIEVITDGLFYMKNEMHYIVYEESELSGLEGHKTCLRIGKNSVAMIRYGENEMRMTFEKDKRHITRYQTPVGILKMEYLTNNIVVDIGEEAGEIKINYDMSIRDLSEANNTLTISYKVLEEQGE